MPVYAYTQPTDMRKGFDGLSALVRGAAPRSAQRRRQGRMARQGLHVDSQTLWDQLHAIARHLAPTYDALGRGALEASVINVDETRWALMGSPKPAAGTVLGVHAPGVSFIASCRARAQRGPQSPRRLPGLAVVDGPSR